MHTGVDVGVVKGAVVTIDDAGTLLAVHSVAENGDSADMIKRIRSAARALTTEVYGDIVNFYQPHGSQTDIHVAIEQPVVGKGVRDSMLIWSVFAISIDNLDSFTNVLPVHPSTLKRFAGVRKKEELMREAFKRYGFEGADNHVVDAFFLAQLSLAVTKGEFDCAPQHKRKRKSRG